MEEIARDFGTTVRNVEQRLRLANIAPDIFEAYKRGDITLDVLQAFGATDNQDRQLTYFKENNHYHPYSIKSAMQRESYGADHCLVKYVGLSAYEAAGGVVERDLFSEDDDIVLSSADILERLVDEKITAACDEYLAAGWSFAERVSSYSETFRTYDRREYSETVDLSDADRARMDEVSAELEEFEFSDVKDRDQIRALLSEYKVLEAKQDFYSEEQKASSGVVVFVDSEGFVDFECGLVHRSADVSKEDGVSKEPDGTGKSSPLGQEEGENPEDPKSAEVAAPSYSGVVLDSLTAMRVKCFQADLAQNHTLARDLLLYNLVNDVFDKFGSCALGISLSNRGERLTAIEAEATPAQQVLTDIHDRLEKLFDVPDDELQTVVFGLSEAEKSELLSYCVATSFKDQLGVRRSNTGSRYFDHSKAVSSAEILIGTDIRSGWVPTSESFCSRLSTKKLLEIGAEIVDDNWALSRVTEKKTNLAHTVAKLFDPDNASLSAEQRARAAKWLPFEMINPDMINSNEIISGEITSVAVLNEGVESDPIKDSPVPDYLRIAG
ncbi:hypothetical protein [Kiloniella sp.]|uniref:hypothetical protein n=1 Tax=Kiloniella sp. TaxID=1938587 RepID=UPI003B02CBA2